MFEPAWSLREGRSRLRPADLIFPPRCYICRTLTESGVLVCPECRKLLKPAGRTLGAQSGAFFRKCYSPILYEGEFRSAFLRFKFSGFSHYAPLFARWMADDLRSREEVSFDLVTFVPLSPLRYGKRGYNQAALLARGVAEELSLPLSSTLRRKHRSPLSRLKADRAARSARVMGIFSPRRRKDLSGMHILLVDDLITTGATLSECARTLLMAGAKEITCLTLARTPEKRPDR